MTEPASIVARIHTRDDSRSLDAVRNRVSLGAIFAGVPVALVVQLLLNLLGAGVGAAVIDPASNDSPWATALSADTALWFVVSGLISSFVGGYVASRLSGRQVCSTGALQGGASWAATTLVIIYLITTSVAALIGGLFCGLVGIFSSAGSTVATAATTTAPALATANDPMANIERNVRDASGGNDPVAMRDAAVAYVRAALTGNETQAADARNKKQATEAAQIAATAVPVGAILAIIALIIGDIAAWIGGSAATPHVVRDQEIYATRDHI